MTRKEEIKQAAKANALQMCNLCLDKYCMEMSLTCPNIHESVITFTDGAKWADEHLNLESLWHDASEEPKSNDELKTSVLIVDEFGLSWVCDVDNRYQDETWEEYITCYHVAHWAYISDLLPKGVKK